MAKPRNIATIVSEIAALESFIARADAKRDELAKLKIEHTEFFAGEKGAEKLDDAKAAALAKFEREMAALNGVEIPESAPIVDTEESRLESLLEKDV